MKHYEFFPEQERGKSEISWLKSNFSFSFANYYNPERMWFWALRVINNDRVAAKNWFAMHPHDNMEIVTIAMEWSLTHRDSLWNHETLVPWEVQAMSAGTWVVHSEINEWDVEWEFFQIWIETRDRMIEPQYHQKRFEVSERRWIFQLLAWNNKLAWNHLPIHQNAYISRVEISQGDMLSYEKYEQENGVYIMNIFWKFVIW